jgi:hypothetical protein
MVLNMIKIIERGNPATEIVGKNFDEITIESNVDMITSSVAFKQNGKIVDRQKIYDDEIKDIIGNLDLSNESRIVGTTIFLFTRQVGEEELEIPAELFEEKVSSDILVI